MADVNLGSESISIDDEAKRIASIEKRTSRIHLWGVRLPNILRRQIQHVAIVYHDCIFSLATVVLFVIIADRTSEMVVAKYLALAGTARWHQWKCKGGLIEMEPIRRRPIRRLLSPISVPSASQVQRPTRYGTTSPPMKGWIFVCQHHTTKCHAEINAANSWHATGTGEPTRAGLPIMRLQWTRSKTRPT